MNASKISVLADELQALLEKLGYADNRLNGVRQRGNEVTFNVVTLYSDGELREVIDFTYNSQLDNWSWNDHTRVNVA